MMYIWPRGRGDGCAHITYAEVWDPTAQWAMISLFHSYLFA